MISRSQLLSLAPHAKPVYLAAFDVSATVLPRFEITTPSRLAHFLAQCIHESGALTILRENLNYSTPERLMQVWPSRFKSVSEALPFVHNPSKLAERVYGGRMGNNAPGDGYRYMGGGLLQTTGREAYRRIGRTVGVDLQANPELIADARYALAAAAAEWRSGGCNQYADADDLERITHVINGGLIGLEERRAWLAKTKKVWPNAA